MNKHTPGPWEVFEQHHPYWDGTKHHTERWIMTGYNDPQLKGRYPIVALSVGVGLTGQKGVKFVHINPADARLISAAPDLLEALQEIVGWETLAPAGVVAQARAAIAKALGEST